MMRGRYIFYVDAEEVITTMFCNSMADHGIDAHKDDEIRCAITVFCNDIKNYLIDHYDLDEVEEGGE